jgi:hypothetical protein
MTDFSHLSDAQFLLVTAPMEADKSHLLTCSDCGREYLLPVNGNPAQAKYCQECGEWHRHHRKGETREWGGEIPHGTIRR